MMVLLSLQIKSVVTFFSLKFGASVPLVLVESAASEEISWVMWSSTSFPAVM